MNNKTWIWPLSWYFRLRELEAENAALRLAYKDLDAKFRAEAIANSIHNTAMASALIAAYDTTRRTQR